MNTQPAPKKPDTDNTPKTPEHAPPDTTQKKSTPKPIGLVALVAVLFVLAGIGWYMLPSFDTSVPVEKDEEYMQEQDTPETFTVMEYSFADYTLDATSFTPKLPDQTIGSSELSNLSDFESAEEQVFTTAQKQALEQNNFFVAQNTNQYYGLDPDGETMRGDDWTLLYQRIGGRSMEIDREPENAVFVTSDFLLHVYHRLLEREFEYIEQKKFYPRLHTMTTTLLNGAVERYADASDELQENYERTIAFFAVAKALLDVAYDEYSSETMQDTNADTKENIISALDALQSELPGMSYTKAREEIDLIMEKKGMTPSPIYGELLKEEGLTFLHDYSQYGPRSHYNKNSVLRSYFRAMMWFGRTNFTVKSKELTQDALLMTQLVADYEQQKNWEDIYMPTVFFVGKSDDLGIYEYEKVMTDLAVTEIDDDVVTRALVEINKLEGPKIMSSAIYGNKVFDTTKEELQEKTKGFRFMGQRFTPDAFVFTTLTQGDELPDEETGESLPSMTTALMVMAAMGSSTAEPLVDDWVENNAPNSKNVIANRLSTLTTQFEQTPVDVWVQNIYWGWLYTIKSLFTEGMDLAGYPGFMKSESWNHKNLQAALGSWTELKHDTLLYAKQSYAEMGAGMPEGEIPPVPKGYVEPNISFFDRLLALHRMTYEGLKNRELLDPIFDGRNEQFTESLEFFRSLAVKELENEVITDEEFEKLRLEGGRLYYVVSQLPGEINTEDSARSALIADVHTDVPGGQILYEATGIPNYMYVAIKDTNGTRLTKGLVFSYYEFTQELGERMTDEKWREWVYNPDDTSLVPPPPAWSAELIK